MASESFESSEVPVALRIALRDAVGGWGDYTQREVSELFQTYGFPNQAEVSDVGGVRRSTAEAHQQRIDWNDKDSRRRYLMLVEDVLQNLPKADDGSESVLAKASQRALKLSGTALPSTTPTAESFDDLWGSSDQIRIFMSHQATHKMEVH